MKELTAENVFQACKYAYDAEILQLFLPLKAEMGPGKRFFESLQRNLLEKVDLSILDNALWNLTPVISFMAEKEHWEGAEFSAEEMFQAVKHLQLMGFFEILKNWYPQLPGAGDRFFEYYQDILVHKVGVSELDRILYTLGQGIRFLATEEALENLRRQ